MAECAVIDLSIHTITSGILPSERQQDPHLPR
jgi:hypothetical protein